MSNAVLVFFSNIFISYRDLLFLKRFLPYLSGSAIILNIVKVKLFYLSYYLKIKVRLKNEQKD